MSYYISNVLHYESTPIRVLCVFWLCLVWEAIQWADERNNNNIKTNNFVLEKFVYNASEEVHTNAIKHINFVYLGVIFMCVLWLF